MIAATWHLILRELRAVSRSGSSYHRRWQAFLVISGVCCWAMVAPRTDLLASERGRWGVLALSGLAGGLSSAAALGLMSRWLGDREREATAEIFGYGRVGHWELLLASVLTKGVLVIFELMSLLPLAVLMLGMGGMATGAVLQLALVLVLLLTVCLAVGALGASTGCNEHSTLANTAGLLLGFLVWLPCLAIFLESRQMLGRAGPWILSSSPGYVLWLALERGGGLDGATFGRSVVALLAMGVLLLVVAGVRLRDALTRDCPARSGRLPSKTTKCRSRWAPGLVGTLRHSSGSDWFAVMLTAGAMVCVMFSLVGANATSLKAAFGLFYAAHLTAKTFQAVAATFALREQRDAGTLANELAAAQAVSSVIDRSNEKLRRRSAWSIRILVLANVATLVVTLARGGAWGGTGERLAIAAFLVIGCVQVLADAYGLRWMGMWQGLRRKESRTAVLITLVTVVVSPWAVAWALVVLNSGNFTSISEVTAYTLCWVAVSLSVSLVAGATAKYHLTRDLRELAL